VERTEDNSSEANDVRQTRRKKEERKTPAEVVRRSGGGHERDRNEEMGGLRNEWQRVLEETF
jgi:hypothetical protein